MVDVFIRNVDEKIYQRFKSRAAQEGLDLGEAFSQIVEKGFFEKKGAAGWLVLGRELGMAWPPLIAAAPAR